MGVARGSLLPELLGEPDENSFGAPEVAEPIHVFMPDHFADELRFAFAESGERQTVMMSPWRPACELIRSRKRVGRNDGLDSTFRRTRIMLLEVGLEKGCRPT